MTKFKGLVVACAISFTFSGCETVLKVASALGVNEAEMALGIKQALEQGLFKTFDAYQNPQQNAVIAFALPGDGQKIVTALNNLGMGSYVNQVTGKFNTAISSAFTTAKPIFLTSLRNMSIFDAAKILLTNNTHAATDYFKNNTKDQLMAAFRPIADSTIKMQGVDKDWAKIARAVNSVPFTNIKVETNLTDFVAARAVDGMYKLVADEEEKIRKDYSFRTTDVMKRVFGYADEEMKKRNGQ